MILGEQFPRALLENLLKRRFFVTQSFEIYGGVAGLFDFGPPGCALKNEVERLWRQHFVLQEDLMEICATNLTPHVVLDTSGHVSRFTDLMVEDEITKECYRADKLLEDFCQNEILQNPKSSTEAKRQATDVLTRAGGMTASEIDKAISDFKVKAPLTKNPLTASFPFNLMFKTSIGPKQAEGFSGTAYLRPETAQGIFVNFKRLLEQNAGKMPFGVAQIGLSFRNEIAPRNGLLRVREFPMGEIEYFVDPLLKNQFSKFDEIAHVQIPMFPRENQLAQTPVKRLTLREAVEQKVVANQTLAYFIGRSFLFLVELGIDKKEGLRFRQHLQTEMAHYAQDCWDAEVLTSYGWIECLGIADRSAYDLTKHAEATKTDLTASRKLEKAETFEVINAKTNKAKLGPKFKKDVADLLAALSLQTDEEKLAAMCALEGDKSVQITSKATGKSYELNSTILSYERATETRTEQHYTPHVIEPSFGFGRIIYGVLEHSFRSRPGSEERNFLALPPRVAPIKCSVLPISGQPQFQSLCELIKKEFLKKDLTCKIDSSTASIGKRYARTDEIGIPFGVTVDFQTLNDQTITLRERDTMTQIRLPISQVADLVYHLCHTNLSWEEGALAIYPAFTEQQIAA